MTSYAEKIGKHLGLRPTQVQAAIDLFDGGNTMPFVARYRKEATGSLDEEQLRNIDTWLGKLRGLDDRRETILSTIEEQGKLTPALKKQLLAADTMTALEDLYQPYKQKRRTRAGTARERGLEDLAEQILHQSRTAKHPAALARPFITPDVPNIEAALSGARDIVAEMISDHASVRQITREKAMEYAVLQSTKIKKAEDAKGVFTLYYDYRTRINRLRPHQILAINRGEAAKVLRVKVEIGERDWLLAIRTNFRPNRRSALAEQMQLAIEDAAKRLLLPAIERDVRRTLAEQAELHAINTFATNLRSLLKQPPLSGHTVLAIDPAYRSGCKVAVIDDTGKVLEATAVYPHAPQRKRDAAKQTLVKLIRTHKATLIVIGNGTASRETEQLAAELTSELDDIFYLMVNEAGASVYSASKLAREELPGMDVSLRGAVSIGRRAQDPLAELVKIDPKSIGVGLYQHDVNQKQLANSLAGVVESVVNQVGVDVNTASPALLAHVSGIGPKLAEQIVGHRNVNGRFPHRQSLQKVRGLGAKAFQQAAGFLRILDGQNPLDASAIHPESYKVATAVFRRAKLNPSTPPAERESALATLKTTAGSLENMAAALKTGVPTLNDIFDQLVRPGRDPREDVPPPILRTDVLAMSDLKTGMTLNGTVRNVVDFGAFIDIGVKQDGLLHRSQIPRHLQLHVGDIIEITVRSVDAERGRIGLGYDQS